MDVWHRTVIQLKKKGYRIFTQLPYLMQRRLFSTLYGRVPLWRNTGRGEYWVVGSWEEMSEMDDFMSLRRVHRHVWVGPKLRGKCVLDIGCGSGYGTYYMSRFAEEIIGIDYDPEAIKWANNHFQRPNLKFINMNALKLNFPPDSFDIVTSFEVIEHFKEEDQDTMINNIKSICKDAAYMTTPNTGPSSVHGRELKMYGTYNTAKHHPRELSIEKFNELLTRHFDSYVLLGQHVEGINNFEDWLKIRGRKLSVEEFEMIDTNLDLCANVMAVCKIGKREEGGTK